MPANIRPFSMTAVEMLLLFLLGLAPAITIGDQFTDLITGKNDEAPAAQEKVITTKSTAQDDRNISKRLQEIFSELEELKELKILVSNGVVTLQGEVDSANNESKALQFARQVEGVVEVKNELVVSRNVKQRLHSTWQRSIKLGQQIIVGLPLYLLAFMLIVLFWWLGGVISEWQGLYRRISPNYFIADLLGQITHLIFIITGVSLALVLLDATALITTILGAAGIVGLAVGFAVRDTVENYIASILLSIRNPFEVNDFVSIDGHEGNVARLTSRATILISPDGNHIRIPNAMVYKAVIINFTRNPERRFQFDVGVGTGLDLLNVQALALSTLNQVPGLLDMPKPTVVIHQLGDSSVIVRIYCWVDQAHHNLQKVRSEAIREIKQAFDLAGVVMPEPVYNVNIPGLQQLKPASASTTTAAPSRVPEPGKTPVNHEAVRDIQDLSVDRTVETKVEEEQKSQDSDTNLLNPDALLE